MRSLQAQIIRELGVKPNINPQEEVALRVRYLANYLGSSAADGYVLGISGGQDSLLAGILAQKAVNRLRCTGREATFHAVLLPYGEQTDRSDALLALDIINPNIVHDLNIKAATDTFATTFEAAEPKPLSDFNKGNVKARMRMIAQYALAGQYNLIVIGTDHAAEAVTGFYTKHGDGAADIVPLAGLTKRQGRQMLEALKVPDIFTTKPPTADLLDNTPGQADETELGISYPEIDNYLEGKLVSDDVAEQIEARYINTAHKRAMPAQFPGA